MQLFDVIPQDFFKPLTGINRHKYMDIIMLIWLHCKRNPIYGESKSVILDWLEDYFTGLNEEISIDSDELLNTEDGNADIRSARFYAAMFLRRLKETGWLEEREAGYEEEPQIVVNHRIVPIIRSFHDVVSPQMITYKVKLFKVYKLLQDILKDESPSLFRPLGYSIIINRNLRVAQLVNLHEMGRIEFQKYETILLLILRLLYVEKRETLSVSEQLVLVSVEEIEGEYNKLNLPRKLDRRMLEAALRTFKKYNLALMLDRLDNSSARIQIFPSVMLAMPEPAITKAYAQTREYLLKYEKANSNSGMEGQADD